MISKEDLLKLKGKANSLEEFRELAVKNNLSFTEEELLNAYKSYQEVSLDDLDNVSGGFGPGGGNIGPTNGRCPNCNTKVSVPSGSYTNCPNCHFKVTADNIRHGLC